MASFTVVVGDPDSGSSYQLEADGQDANRFMGKSIGEEVDGAAVGLDGYTLEITGGSDDAGRPLNPDVAGSSLTEVLMEGRQVGYKPERSGERRRITVRGSEISDAVAQINASVADAGSASIEDLLGGGDDGEDADE
ncbi:30S ribosomal protein S6e [Natrarchaeobaculum aegyptiacum]|uniref:Small ribosomal subunit protein eS6 n=1 Tax=Natrarchaeobaculum aegyptiacum TaxID=745377 RepID=A0A2Z2HTS8_9EURY|nr:30S ribosomal protein S6e [Natrarchaeobaculum aegyptiacum]ARS90610.1 30S ribosomal protein S6e [Natrarchaeobaculum aegyptiacum]